LQCKFPGKQQKFDGKLFGSGYFLTQNPKLFCTSLQEKMSKSDPRRLMSFGGGVRLCIFSRDEAKKSRL
jgi:hypothetical protein